MTEHRRLIEGIEFMSKPGDWRLAVYPSWPYAPEGAWMCTHSTFTPHGIYAFGVEGKDADEALAKFKQRHTCLECGRYRTSNQLNNDKCCVDAEACKLVDRGLLGGSK